MIVSGVYPAAVTPLDERGRIDFAGLAKLLAWFESAGCRGAVLAGTNGEGPSLSATEKRELIEQGMNLRGKLELILGVATPSLEEAVWLCRRGADAGAAAVLAMAPGYFREASESGIRSWFQELLDRSPLPILIYNFPQRTGITLTAETMSRLAEHPNMAGLKDSSGESSNLASYRAALPDDKVLFVGNETLLLDALREGWTGTISGAANSVPQWLCQIVSEWFAARTESAEAKFRILLPVLEAIRRTPQPAGHKGVLHRYGIIPTAELKLPLERAPIDVVQELLEAIEQATGFAVRP